MQEFELAIEEQAYPFEEKAIAMHKSNLELISRGVYDEWIDRSLQKLAELVPARYDKPEEESAVIASPDSYLFAIEDSKPAMHKARKGATEQTGEVSRDAQPTAAEEAAKADEQAKNTHDRVVTTGPDFVGTHTLHSR